MLKLKLWNMNVTEWSEQNLWVSISALRFWWIRLDSNTYFSLPVLSVLPNKRQQTTIKSFPLFCDLKYFDQLLGAWIT